MSPGGISEKKRRGKLTVNMNDTKGTKNCAGAFERKSNFCLFSIKALKTRGSFSAKTLAKKK